MRVIVFVITAIASVSLATGAGAQQKTPAPRKETAPKKLPDDERCIDLDRGRIECRLFRYDGDSIGLLRRRSMDSVLMKRAALGLHLTPTGSMRDTLGVFVARVTAKGPAENAGIVEGDRIVSINGVDLRVNPADAGDSYASGLPSRRLNREVSKLAPGNVATLRVYSGGRTRDVRVTLGRASDLLEAGPFGAIFDRFDGDGIYLRSFPNLENMRIPLERMRLEEMRLRDIPFSRGRMITPMRVRDFVPMPIYSLDDDGIIRLERSKKADAERANAKKKK